MEGRILVKMEDVIHFRIYCRINDMKKGPRWVYETLQTTQERTVSGRHAKTQKYGIKEKPRQTKQQQARLRHL